MKHNNTLNYTEKCRFYSSLQQLFLPTADDDLTPPPQAAAAGELLSALPIEGYSIAVFREAGSLPSDWGRLLPEGNLVLSQAYLQLFEQHSPENMGFAYLMLYKGHQVAGLAVCQLMDFNAMRQIQSLSRAASGTLLNRGFHMLKREVARRINARLIVCGLTQFSGEFAYVFDEQMVSSGLQPRLLAAGIGHLSRLLEEEGWKPSGVLAKDFYAERLPQLQPLSAEGYTPFAFQPNMLMDIREDWHTMDDYLNAMSSKYRIRARRAFKKCKPIRCEELDAEGVHRHLEAMHELYLEVSSQADFNLLELPASYFLALKQAFPGQFRVLAYFHEERLVGFCTALRNGNELEAHFIGFRQHENREYQLYLNMLYDMVRLAIEEERAERLIFSRTAMEIKSSVGAEPKDMYCYIRHFSPYANRFAPLLVQQLQPDSAWQQRHPFSQQED
ncbi:MAG: GNAT family N-acetyltransferase [Phaeodactylibacter sp.]|nr:GNAT family N-acetyltransferase [Phaeodactylibacter sp.]MCB9273195.1 GNAT family N-acetyltransferase [Lewinellaceae bacterium]